MLNKQAKKINKKKEDKVMMNIENLVSAVCKGEEISIHKTGVGKVRENCVYAKNLKEVPLAKLGEHLSP